MELVTMKKYFYPILFAVLVSFSFAVENTIPLHIEEGFTQINGTQLFYKIIGKGTPIVILHGGPGLDHSYLLPQMAELAKTHRLIFFDQRASGKSSVDSDTNSMTMKNLVEDVEGIRKAFKLGKMNLMGHSWGGLLAMFYAIRFPNNLKSLMIVNTTPASSEIRNASFKIMSERTSKEDSIAQAAIMQSDDFKQRKPEAMSKFFRILFRGTFANKKLADELTLTFPPDQAARSKMMSYLSKDTTIATYDIHPKLAVIKCQALIVGADYDQVPPEANERIHQSIKNSKLVVLKECGHFPYIEQPKEFFSTVRNFVKKSGR